jgi:hypothetical protein
VGPGGLLVREGFAKPDPPFGFSVEELSKAAEWDKDNEADIVRFLAEKVK